MAAMSNPFLTIVVPSRGRPHNARALATQFHMTRYNPTTLLVVAVDDDDPTLPEYEEQAASGLYKLRVGPPLRIGGTLNLVVPEEAEEADYVGFMGDDHRPRTTAWDQLYINNLRDMGTGVVYGNDLIQGPSLPTQCAMTSNIVRATGHFVPEGMLHLWLDNAWKSIGEATKIRYLNDVIIEHMHPLVGKADWDESYQRNNADEVFSADKAVYEHWRVNILPDWVEKIRNFNG